MQYSVLSHHGSSGLHGIFTANSIGYWDKNIHVSGGVWLMCPG